MLGVSLYVLGDTMIVGRGLRAAGLTALNISIPMINVLNAVGLLFGIGGSTLISKALGEGKKDKAHRLFTKSLILSAVAGILLTILFMVFMDPLCRFLGASDAAFLMVRDYLSTFLAFALPFILFSAGTALIRNDNGARLVMIALLSGSVFNVVFDYIFIFKLGMGMRGAALATGLAPCVGLVILSLHYFTRRNTLVLRFSTSGLKRFWQITAAGTSGFVLELSSGIIIFAYNFVILRLAGDIGVSSYSIVANLALIITAMFLGIALGIQPLISYHEGAQNKTMIDKVFRLGMQAAFLAGLFFLGLGLLFPRFLAGLFIQDEAVMTYAIPGVRLFFIAFPMMGMNIVWTMKYQSQNRIGTSLFVSLFRGLLFLLISLFALSALFKMTGVWLSMPFTELACLGLLMFLHQHEKKKAA
jgi:putative MATE family efflux protein